MKINCLASSSSGNCYLVEFVNPNSGKSKNLLLEAGLPVNEIIKGLLNIGFDLNDIDAVLITHEHKDHSRAALDLFARGKRVFAPKSVFAFNIDILKSSEVKLIASDIMVIPFEVEHDSEEALGFIIQSNFSNETLLFINDAKFIKYDLSGFKFDYVMIECNYDSQIVHIAYNNAKKNKSSDQYRYKRLLDSHMSNTNCVRTLEKLDLSKCKAIFLMHLSDGHSDEIKFKKQVKEATGIDTYICKKHGGIF